MVDFKKLNDPVWRAEVRAKEDARQALEEARDAKLRTMINTCRDHFEELSSSERSLVLSCHTRLATFDVISEKQEIWLTDIAKRFPGGMSA